MLDELYKLDYEDVVAGMPTRFKYRKVQANTYGLSTDEILFSRDTTLKQFVSLAQMAPYNDAGEEYFPGSKKRKRFREWAKKDLEDMQRKDEEEVADSHDGDQDEDDAGLEEEVQEEKPKKRKRRRQKKKGTKTDDEVDKGSSAADAHIPAINSKANREKDETKKEKPVELVINKKPKNKQNDNDAKKSSSKAKSDVRVKEKNHDSLEKKKKNDKSNELQNKEKPVKKKRKKNKKIDGVASSRLASYGL